MKRLAVLMVAGSLVISGATGLNTVKAADMKKGTAITKEAELSALDPLDKDFSVNPSGTLKKSMPSLTDLLKKDTKLTEAEKKEIKSLHDELTKKRDLIDDLSDRIYEIASKITNNHAIDKKYSEAVKKYQALWDKLDETTTDDMLTIESNIEYIKASKALTDKEKETLIKGEEKLDALGAEYDKIYEKVDAATKDLSAKVDSLYEDVVKLVDKITPLAKKLGGDFERNYGFEDKMLY